MPKKETKRRTDLTGRHDVTVEEIMRGLLPGDDKQKGVVKDIPPPEQKKSKWDKLKKD